MRQTVRDREDTKAALDRIREDKRQPPAYERIPERPRVKPVVDFRGLELNMRPQAYRAVKSAMWKGFELNIARCGWSQGDCLTHLLKDIPRAYRVSVGKMQTLTELSQFLDRQYENSTTDVEEESWDAIRIGDKSVADLYTEIEDMAEVLSKDLGQMDKCFVRAFKEDFPDAWRKLRTDWKDKSLTSKVNCVKEWIELTRTSVGAVASRRQARVGAVVAPADAQEEGESHTGGVVAAATPNSPASPPGVNGDAVSAMRNELQSHMSGLGGLIRDLSATLNSVMPSVKANPAVVLSQGGGAGGVNDRPLPTLPTSWLPATVERVGPADGFAKVQVMTGGTAAAPDRPLSAVVLSASAPLDVRRALRLGQKLRVKIERDARGIRVVSLDPSSQ